MTAPVLIAGDWRDAQQPTGTFTALEPSTGNALPDAYPISSAADVEAACAAGAAAVEEGRRMADLTDRLAAFLEGYADRI